MALRKDVFRSKVLQKLYPPPRKEEVTQIPQCATEKLTKDTPGKEKVDAAKKQSLASAGRRMYTVLPPPPDIHLHSQESAPPYETEERRVDEVHESDGDSQDEEKTEEQIGRKRKRRKRKPAAKHTESEKEVSSSVRELFSAHSPGDEGGERISKNKKRKLKKKRHKEKLLSMGLMPRASALEFTYQKDVQQEEEEEEWDGESAVEVTDFLRRTLEMYKSDSKASPLSAPLDDLLQRVVSRSRPDSVLRQLHSLKVLLQANEREKLEEALKELHNNCDLSPEETSALTSLFHYWTTDILPMQADEKTRLSSAPH